MKKKLRLLLLAGLLAGTALLAEVGSANACIREMCFEVDLNTVCCWSETCELQCWDW